MRFVQQNISAITSWIFCAVGALIFAGCSAGGSTTSATTTPTPTGTAGTGVVASVTLVVGGTSITADGSSSVFLRATVLDTAGVAMQAKTVSFSTTAGLLSASSATTDASGVAQVTLTAPVITGVATLSASHGGAASAPATVNFLPGAVAAIGINAQPSNVLPGGTTTLTVAAIDANGNPVAAGQIINFSTTAAGTFSSLTGITDADGRASVTYTASSAVGVQVLNAKAANGIAGSANLTVASNIAVIGSISVAPSNPQIAVGGGTTVLNATVLDTADQPVQGAAVTFSSTSGTLSASSATTNASGIASVVLTSGALVQAAKVTASASGYSSTTTVMFGAGAPAAIGLNPAPNTAIPGGQSTITAAVVDGGGNPVAGEMLTFFFVQRGSGTPSLSATSVATDVNGLASVTYTAGANAGTDIINAITSNSVLAAGASRATVTVASNVTVVGSVVAATSVASIPVTTGTALISATVKDTASKPLAGQTVVFAASSGTLSGVTATDSNGIATATLTAGSSILTSTVSATVGGFTSNVSVAFTAGAANSVAVSAAPATVGTAGTSTVTALVLDASNNPVVGEAVTFAFTAKGSGLPTLGSTTATSNANGLAVVSYKAGANAGTDTISATTSNAKVGVVSIISSAAATVVNGITVTTGATSIPSGGAATGGTTAVRATVVDTNGAAASGVTVNFSTSAGTLSSASAVTDSAGIAQVTLTSSNNLGTAMIIANADGFVASASVTFTSSNPSSITLLSGTNSLTTGGTSTLTAVVLDANGNAVANETVTFVFTANPSGASLSAATATTSVNGIASVLYTAGTTLGTDTVVAKLTNGTASTAVNLLVGAGAIPSSLSIAASSTSVKSDNSDNATITVTALNAGNVVVPGIVVNFAADGGALGFAQATTNASGQATVTFSAGSANQNNRTVNVTASAAGATSVSIPVQVTGSSLALATNGVTNLVSGASPTTSILSIKATNAGGVGVYNAPVTLAVSGAGNVTLSASSGTTDVNGELAVSVTGLTSGIATVTVSALGATATQTYTVSASGSEFRVTAPAANPAAVGLNVPLPFAVQTGASGAVNIRLSTSLGTWSGCNVSGNTTSVCTVTAAAPNATLTSSLAGIASVQVEALDGSATPVVLATDSRSVGISSSSAAAITVQSNVSVVPPSQGGTANSATITATVRDANGQVAGNVPITFSIVNPTGGGETLYPVYVLSSASASATDPLGQARTTFTSGALPSGNGGLIIRGKVVGSGNDLCLNTEGLSNNGGTAICADTKINIGNTAGSIALGLASKIIVNADNTTYSYPVTLLVADSNGNPVSGAVVSLNAWPTHYYTGTHAVTVNQATRIITVCSDRYDNGLVTAISGGEIYETTGGVTGEFLNEDVNSNLILDAGEDGASANLVAGSCLNCTATSAPDGLLSPSNSAAGALPAAVTTDASGLANFNLTYLKQYSHWIAVRITAKTFVQGSETATSITFVLPAEVNELSSCELPSSPFN